LYIDYVYLTSVNLIYSKIELASQHMCKQLKCMYSGVWDVTLCRMLNSYRLFGRAIFVHRQCLAVQDEVLLDPGDGSRTIF